MACQRDEGRRSRRTYFVSNKTTALYLLHKHHFTVIANIYWVLPMDHTQRERPSCASPFFPQPQEAGEHHHLCFMAGKTQAHDNYVNYPRSNNKGDKDLERRSQSGQLQSACPDEQATKLHGKPGLNPLFNSRSSICIPLIIRITDDYWAQVLING